MDDSTFIGLGVSVCFFVSWSDPVFFFVRLSLVLCFLLAACFRGGLLYEFPRRKPGWRFTAGAQWCEALSSIFSLWPARRAISETMKFHMTSVHSFEFLRYLCHNFEWNPISPLFYVFQCIHWSLKFFEFTWKCPERNSICTYTDSQDFHENSKFHGKPSFPMKISMKLCVLPRTCA